jgi:hypothetical protein
MVARYSITNPIRALSKFFIASFTYTKDYIGNSVSTLGGDTTLTGGIRGTRGAQISQPVNLSGYWNARGFAVFGIPFELISSNLSFNTGINFTRTPGLVQGLTAISSTTVFSQGVVIASNISQDVDFNVNYTGNYTIGRNSLQADQNSNYYSHTAGVMLNLTFWEGTVFRNELNHSFSNGLSAGYNTDALLWNISLAKKFLADQKAEVRLTVTDVLQQNKSATRNITETYIEDSISSVLPRYAMLTFSYTMR